MKPASFFLSLLKPIILAALLLCLHSTAFSQQTATPDYASSINELASYYYESGNYAEALRLFNEAMQIYEQTSGKENSLYLSALNNSATCNGFLGNYDEAIRLGTDVLTITESLYGKRNSEYTITLSNLASYYSYIGNFNEAIRLGTEALNIRESISGKNTRMYATSLSNLASYNIDLGNYAEAIRLATEGMNIFESILGKNCTGYAVCLRNLAVCYSKLGNYDEAIRLGTEDLSITENILSKNHPDYATSLNLLASYYFETGNVKEAIRLGTEALTVRKNVFSENHPAYAETLGNLASYRCGLGNYAEAIILGTEALAIIESLFGKYNHIYPNVLSNLATFHSLAGKHSEALLMGTEALNIGECIYGKDHTDYAHLLNILSNINSAMGNYVEAIRLGREAFNIFEAKYGRNHPDCAQALNNLADCYADLGNYSMALQIGTEVLRIDEILFDREHPTYLKSLSNLAAYNLRLGNYSEALRVGTEVMNLRRTILSEDHPDYATSLNNLAVCYSEIGDFAEAIRLSTRALNIRENILGKNHPDYAISLNNLAKYNIGLGKNSEAIRLCTEALSIYEKTLSKNHPDYISALKNLAFYYHFSDSIPELEAAVTEASSLNAKLVRYNFSSLTAFERQNFWEAQKYWFEETCNIFAHAYPTAPLVEAACDMAILAKGILLNSERDFASLIAESNDSVAVAQFDQLLSTRRWLNKLYEKPVAERLVSTDSLEAVAQSIERDLMQRSKEFGDYTRNMSIGWREVRQKLKNKDVAIEFVSFPTQGDTVQYSAYVINKQMESPRMVNLFTNHQLDSIAPDDYYTSTRVAQLVWGGLDEYISPARNIYFAPAGNLYNIAVEWIPHYSRQGLMADHHRMFRLSSTRELAVVGNKPNRLTRAALFGGMAYGAPVEVPVGEDSSSSAAQPSIIQAPGVDFSIAENASASGLRSDIADLPGTRIEVQQIEQTMKRKSLTPEIYTDNKATEGAFKNLYGKDVNIAHIATHGFYWSEKEVRRSPGLRFLMNAGDDVRHSEDKALNRSGLLFAGARNVLNGVAVPENANDGILTAKEIADLDLRATDLVVLSACQTGLGEIRGDGVFGLQRGFKKAGVRTLLMSLWKVDDNATRLLMTRFYDLMLSGNTDRLDALMQAQQYVRDYTDADNNKPYAHPRFWAAFILLDALN